MNLRLRVVTCLFILSVLLTVIFLTDRAASLIHDPDYTENNPGVATTNGVYYAEMWNGNGWIYNLDYNGKVRNMICSKEVYESFVDDVIVSNGKVYGLFSSVIFEDEDVDIIYNIVEMDPELNPLRQIDDIRIYLNENTGRLSTDGEFFYITVADEDEADVFQVPANELVDVKYTPVVNNKRSEKKLSEMEEPNNILYKKLNNNEVFADALYQDGTLFVRTDRDMPSGVFLLDSRIRDAVNKIHFGPIQQVKLYSNYVVYFVGIVLIWFILTGILYHFLKERNRVAYMVFTMEFTLLIVLTASFIFVRSRYRDATKQEASRFAILTLQGEMDLLGDLDSVDFSDKDFYDSTEYANIYSSIKRFAVRDGNAFIFNYVMLVRLSDGVILVDSRGNNGSPISWYLGNAAGRAVEKLRDTASGYANDDFILGGTERLIVGVKEDDLAVHKYGLVGVLSGDDPFIGVWGNTQKTIFFLVVIFIEASALILIILYLQHSDIKHFEQEIREVALGKTKVQVPDTPARDMKTMWNSLSEIGKRIEGVNYERFRIFEGYYRFAPKDIETIMDKDSIFDVKDGDMTRGEGTLMLVSTGKNGYGSGRLKGIQNVISYMDNYVGDKEGIMVSHDSTLSLLQFLFLKDSKDTVSKAVQLLHRNDTDPESDNLSVFIYMTSFTYGVLGINDKSLTFLTSENAKQLEQAAEWLDSKKVPLVVTEWVKDRDNPDPLRYIGFIRLRSGEGTTDVKLFEVLDACPARMRMIKQSLKDRFEETIEHFYNKDFYLARNRFSEILKECPEDEMARWYLFECERYLNEGVNYENHGELPI